MSHPLAVVIPTRNRPEKLKKCLSALGKAREHIDFVVYACDSSDREETRAAVKEVCSEFHFVRHHLHQGKNAAAARNFCANVAEAELLITVDDDVYVEPESIKKLVEAYHSTAGLRIVSGSVAWGKNWSKPVVMRLIGYGREAQPGEQPSFVVSAFLLYPRSIALALPWNERIRTSEDRFMGSLWRGRGVQILFEPAARAFHDDQHNTYSVKEQESHIYANLFDALIANPDFVKGLSYEFLGFAAGAKLYFRRFDSAIAYIRAWIRGHQSLIRDWSYLQDYLRRPLPRIEQQPSSEYLSTSVDK